MEDIYSLSQRLHNTHTHTHTHTHTLWVIVGAVRSVCMDGEWEEEESRISQPAAENRGEAFDL